MSKPIALFQKFEKVLVKKNFVKKIVVKKEFSIKKISVKKNFS